MVLGKLDSHVQKSNPISYHTEESIQKWVKDLNVRSKTMKLWEKNIYIRGKFLDIGLGNGYFRYDIKSKDKSEQVRLQKIKHYRTAKETIENLLDERKYFQIIYLIKN